MSRNRDPRQWGREWLPWVGIALAAGLAAVAGSFLAVGLDPTFVVDPVDDVVVVLAPAFVLDFSITVLGDLGALLAFGVALVLATVLLGAVAIPGVLALRDGRRGVAVVLAAALPGVATAAITLDIRSALGAAGGAGLAVLVATVFTGAVARADRPVSAPRRAVLGAVGTALGAGALGVLTRGSEADPTPDFVEIPEDAAPEVREKLSQAREQSLDVAGIEPLVSTDFYEVDINSVANPRVDEADWTLSVTGAVGSEVTLDMADVRDLPMEQRFVTLRCVGDYLNGDKMDNALWGGVPMEAILEMAEPRGEYVMLRAADAYYNEFPIEALWPGLLAYRMNGRPLPQAHGAPARALVPGHWGEINVKWLQEIEVLDEPARGYWEKRGWHGTGPVKTVAKLWQANHLGGGRVELAGHAYGGTRGIRAVEVSTDGGETWAEAELSDPLPGDDVWRQWRHEYAASERHEAVVRAIDGTGAIQIPEQAGPKPEGATGWVSQEISPR